MVALGFTSLFTDISSEMVTAVLPIYLTATLGFSTLGFGIFEGAYQLVSALFRLVGGSAADRTQNHKRVAASGYALSAATRVGLLVSTAVSLPVVPLLLADRVGKGIRSAPRDALISLSTAPERLATAFGIHRTLDTTGAMLGPFVAFAILWLTPGAYDSVFVVSLVAAVIGVIIISTFVEPVPVARAAAVRESSASLPSSLAGAIRRPEVRRIGMVALVLGLVSVSDGFIYLIIQQQADLTLAYFPLLFVGTALVYLVLAVPFGHLADRFERRHVFVAGHVALLAVYLVLRQTEVPGVATVALCLALLGVFYAATDGVLPAAVAAVSGEGTRSSAIAVVTVAAALGRMVAAVGFGFLWRQNGLTTALSISIAGMAVALMLGWHLLRPPRPTGGHS